MTKDTIFAAGGESAAEGDDIPIAGVTEEKRLEILAFFEAIYGEEGMLLLQAYIQAGHEIVVDDLYDIWTDRWSSDLDGVTDLTIELDEALNSVEMADHLMRKLVEALGYDGYGMRVALTSLAMRDDDIDRNEFALIRESYKQSLLEGASTAATLAEMYITGLVETTPGGWVIVSGYYVDEGEHGNAALAALPGALKLKGKVLTRVGQSELGNALSGLGSNPLTRNLNSLDEFGTGAGFSGVFDPATGKFLAYPSGSTRLANGGTPANLVDRYGGHADVNRVLSELLGSNTNNRLGFSMVLDDAGNFAVRFNSGSINGVNPNFPGSTVPESMRQQILDAIKSATGRGAYSNQ